MFLTNGRGSGAERKERVAEKSERGRGRVWVETRRWGGDWGVREEDSRVAGGFRKWEGRRRKREEGERRWLGWVPFHVLRVSGVEERCGMRAGWGWVESGWRQQCPRVHGERCLGG